MLEDIAILTGAEVISEDKGLKLDTTTIHQVGGANKVKVTKDKTIIVDGHSNEDVIAKRVELIKRQIEETTSDYDREKLKERLAKLSDGVAVIKVGAATETKMKEKKLRIEDALNATRADVEEEIDVEIVKKALTAPLRQIAENAGIDDSGVVVEKVKSMEDGYGFDAATEEYVDMVHAGIIDPLKVTRSAIQNSASVSELVLTTEVVVAEKKSEISKNSAPMPPMM